MEGKVFARTTAAGDGGGECWDEGPRGEPRQIFICHGDSINSIQAACGSDSVILLQKRGGHGDKFNVVNFGSRSITRIRGYYGHYQGAFWNPVVVRCLAFETDDGSVYGPFGTEEGESFSFHLDGSKIGGFHGRSCDRFLRAIGIYVETDATSTTYTRETSQGSSLDGAA